MRRCVGAAWLAALAAACGGSRETATLPAGKPEGSAAIPVESTIRATTAATAGARASAIGSTATPRILFVGTSLTAGYGLDDPGRDAYPAVLQRLADSAKVTAQIVNAGLSGETSAGALRRADWLLRTKSDIVVIETGANDGLRGLDPESTAANIRSLIGKFRAANPATVILLAQMEAPTNLGARYTRRFHDLFVRVAREDRVTLVPFLLDGVAGVKRLNQGDGIHPTPEGARMVARNVWPTLERALRR